MAKREKGTEKSKADAGGSFVSGLMWGAGLAVFMVTISLVVGAAGVALSPLGSAAHIRQVGGG